MAITDHFLEGLKGWLQDGEVDYKAPVSSAVTIPVYAGRVVHLNANGEVEMGIPATIGAGNVPLFVVLGNDLEPMNVQGGDTATDPNAFAAPSLELPLLVSTRGYELASTEYDSAQSYSPGTLLTAANSNTDVNTGGVLKPATLGTDPVCGVVSRGVGTWHYKNALAFWTYYDPKRA